LIFVCCESHVLSGRRLCDELITRPEESYRLWRVLVCDLETSWMRRPWPTGGLSRKRRLWVGGQRHAPAALPTVMTRYPLYRRLGGPQGRSARLRKVSDSIPRLSSLYWIAIPTELTRPLRNM
jgi:hypothetical protein